MTKSICSRLVASFSYHLCFDLFIARSLTVNTGCVFFLCTGILLSTEASINSQIALVKRDGKYYVDVYGGSGRMLNTTGVGREYFI